METPEQLVQRQLDAYNHRDIEAFLATYHEDAELFNFPGELYLKGRDPMRARYSKLFESPGLHAKIVNRTTLGRFVLDHEVVTVNDVLYAEAIAIYEVVEGLIQRVSFIKE